MKHSIRTLISSRKLFFQTMLFLLMAAVLLLLFFGRSVAFISSDAYHPFWANVFFINYTFMGNGLFVICLASLFIFRFKRKQQGLAILYGFLLSGFVVQLLKNINSLSHPTVFFEQGQNFFLPNNILLTDHGSFISGHTATAFALATVLMMVVKDPKWQLPILIAALLLGYSRMYLAQHYLLEIMTGAVLGTVSGIAAVYIVYYFKGYGFYFKKFFNMHKSGAISRERNIQTV